MSERAVIVSHELWKQIMTTGYASGGLRCVEGIPPGATLSWVFCHFFRTSGEPDPVFVFESDAWKGEPSKTTVDSLAGPIPVHNVVFERA